MTEYDADGFESTDYTDPDWLRARHFDDEMTMGEMGDVADVSRTTIRRRMKKHDISPRSANESRKLRGTQDNGHEHGVHNEKEWLDQKYRHEKLTIAEMANEADVTGRTIRDNMAGHGLELRPSYVESALQNPGACFVHAGDRGYELIEHRIDGEVPKVRLHRLLAVAEFGFGEVVDKDVHHRNGIPWANWPGNIELMGHAEHTAHHRSRREYDTDRDRDPETGRFV